MQEGDLFRVETVDWTGGQIKDDDCADDIKHVDLNQVRVNWRSNTVQWQQQQEGMAIRCSSWTWLAELSSTAARVTAAAPTAAVGTGRWSTLMMDASTAHQGYIDTATSTRILVSSSSNRASSSSRVQVINALM